MKLTAKSFTTYMVAIGVVVNLILVVSLLYLGKTVFSSGLPLPIWAKKVQKSISIQHPSIKSIVSPVLNAFQAFYAPDYYYRSVDAFNWHGIGASKVKDYSIHNYIEVNDSNTLLEALQNAQSGQSILLRPGEYEIDRRRIDLNGEGKEAQPITVIAERLGLVTLKIKGEGIVVDQPYWQFKNLHVVGNCNNEHSNCDHAFHVVGKGKFFKLENSILQDFNAAIKVNGVNGEFPDYGTVLGNTIFNSTARNTSNPVTPIDLMHADSWHVKENFIYDIAKSAGNKIAYAAFFKGGSSYGLFENNLIICQANLRSDAVSIGLSLGGGGSPLSMRRNNRLTEHEMGTIRQNIIMHCQNDVGIYLNRSKGSIVENNLLYNTQGIDVRFTQSDAVIRNNILSGRIKARDGSTFSQSDNVIAKYSFFTGKEGLNNYFWAPNIGNFNRKKALSSKIERQSEIVFDWCNEGVKDGYVGVYGGQEFCLEKIGL